MARPRTRTAAISTTSARSGTFVVVSMSTTVKSRNAELAPPQASSCSALNSASGRPSTGASSARIGSASVGGSGSSKTS